MYGLTYKSLLSVCMFMEASRLLFMVLGCRNHNLVNLKDWFPSLTLSTSPDLDLCHYEPSLSVPFI